MHHAVSLLLARPQPPHVAFVDVHYLVEGELVDVAGQVRLHQLEQVRQVHRTLVGQFPQNGVELKNLAVRIEFGSDIYPSKKVPTKSVELLKIGAVFLLSVPQHALKPLYLPFEQGDVAIGLHDLHRTVFDLPHHLHEYLQTFCFNDFFPQDEEDGVELVGILSSVHKFLIFLPDLFGQRFLLFFKHEAGANCD
jgi:hypothetical protein